MSALRYIENKNLQIETCAEEVSQPDDNNKGLEFIKVEKEDLIDGYEVAKVDLSLAFEWSKLSKETKRVVKNSGTSTAFIAGGIVAGAGVSTAFGGMGLAGGFGAVGIGTVPVVCAGAVASAAAYGAFKAIAEGDATAYGAMGIGAAGGAGISSVVGSMGLVAPKIGLAFGIGTVPMAAAGAVVGLAAYGIAKLLDETGTSETPAQLFDRMEEKVLQMEDYSTALIELDLFLSGEDLNHKFVALEVEDELEALKAQINSGINPKNEIDEELEALKAELRRKL
jgi:hypothetical protein